MEIQSWSKEFVPTMRDLANSGQAISTRDREMVRDYFLGYPAAANAYDFANWTNRDAPSVLFLDFIRESLIQTCSYLCTRNLTEDMSSHMSFLIQWVGYCCLAPAEADGSMGRTVPDAKACIHLMRVRTALFSLARLFNSLELDGKFADGLRDLGTALLTLRGSLLPTAPTSEAISQLRLAQVEILDLSGFDGLI